MFLKIAASVNLENGLNPGMPYVFRTNSYPWGGCSANLKSVSCHVEC